MSVLIAYAGKYGCTAKCASILESQLTGPVSIVNLHHDPLPDLAAFEKIIIGGSIYYGQLQKPCVRLFREHLKTLLQKKVGVFICCGSPDQSDQFVTHALPSELRDSALKISCFGGELKPDAMSWWDRFVTAMVARSAAKKNAPPSTILHEAIADFSAAMNKA
ncbi:flavodoxin domain-containing protein [Fontibacillus sp. BL9]|uniref:flavodoxin domain-containing protein n=1 Tax=Fontibacillus sp. BL9 TaxID=3389971 RepID=UPI003979626D